MRLLNVAFHNAFVVYNSRNKTHDLNYRSDLIKALILTHKPQVLLDLTISKPSIRKTWVGTSWKKILVWQGGSKTPKKVCCLFITEEKAGVDILVS
jgi:hypothetical protein